MAILLTWRLGTPDGTQLEQVDLDEDGRVGRLVTDAGPQDPVELGWWTGDIDDVSLAAAAELAGPRWPDGARDRPFAGPAWSVEGARGRIALGERDDPALGELRALLATCAEAATTASAVVELTGSSFAFGGTQTPVVRARSVGSGLIVVALGVAGAPVAMWADDEAEVHGYVGNDVAIQPGKLLTAALQGVVVESHLDLVGEIAREDGARATARASVAVEE